MHDTDWNGRDIELARSARGVYACRNPWDGLVRGDVAPWPPPELVQKLYKSRHTRAYRDADLSTATAAYGYYADLQSVHSEDAVTWSLFGPMIYATRGVRASYTSDLLALLQGTAAPLSPAHVWLWRRLPHPDSLVPGGPEIDFGIQTANTLVLGEAKWRSRVGAAQGVDGLKDQIQLRVEFCEKYGSALYPTVEQFVVLLVSPDARGLSDAQRARGSDRVKVLGASWEHIGGLASNPWRTEFLAQLQWRKQRSQAS